MTTDSDAHTVTKPDLRLGVLISGTGRTLRNLIQLSQSGNLPADVAVVISSTERAGGLRFARDAGIPAHVVVADALDDTRFADVIATILRRAAVDLVCMAGFLRLWRIPADFAGKVMNIHPALLPDFGGPGFFGDRVHRAVLDSGAGESGCTVHFADNQFDHGPIILQHRVQVFPGDTPARLAERVFEQERIAYPQAIRLFAAGRIELRNGVVRILEEDDPIPR